MSSDTIFARSSGAGRAGVAVFRISGPLAGPTLDAMTGGRGRPRAARLCRVHLSDGSILDEGLAIWFPRPRSFTGEDVAELHLHGSLAVERGLSDDLTARGVVPATAGAFTLRAFENGKLDLSQAEGLGDLLRAETDGQRRHALGQLGGTLSEKVEGWRRDILAILALLTAAVDFPDEEDVATEIGDDVRRRVGVLRGAFDEALAGADAGVRLRDGVRIVLTGPPNVGKSSLLNALAQGDHAIVSDMAGTTRDVIETRIERQGQLVVLVDTAGIRETDDTVERIGVDRARKAAASADIEIALRPASDLDGPAPRDGRLYAATKTDLLPGDDAVADGWIPVSVVRSDGLDHLLRIIDERVGGGHVGVLTRRRHVELVRTANAVLASAERENAPELVEAEVRRALRLLDEIVGYVSPDEVLGAVFSEFCIGK